MRRTATSPSLDETRNWNQGSGVHWGPLAGNVAERNTGAEAGPKGNTTVLRDESITILLPLEKRKSQKSGDFSKSRAQHHRMCQFLTDEHRNAGTGFNKLTRAVAMTFNFTIAQNPRPHCHGKPAAKHTTCMTRVFDGLQRRSNQMPTWPSLPASTNRRRSFCQSGTLLLETGCRCNL